MLLYIENGIFEIQSTISQNMDIHSNDINVSLNSQIMLDDTTVNHKQFEDAQTQTDFEIDSLNADFENNTNNLRLESPSQLSQRSILSRELEEYITNHNL